MINEEVLVHIIKEMNFHLTGLAKEIDPQKIPMDGIRIDNEFISLKYIREKTMAIKTHLEWLQVEIDGV